MKWIWSGCSWKAEEKRGAYVVRAEMWKPSKRHQEPTWGVRVTVSRPEGGCVHHPHCPQGGRAADRVAAERVVEGIASSTIAWDQEHGPPLPMPATPEALAAGQERVERVISLLGQAQDELMKLHSPQFVTRAHLNLAGNNLERTLKAMRNLRGQGEMDLGRLFIGKDLLP